MFELGIIDEDELRVVGRDYYELMLKNLDYVTRNTFYSQKGTFMYPRHLFQSSFLDHLTSSQQAC